MANISINSQLQDKYFSDEDDIGCWTRRFKSGAQLGVDTGPLGSGMEGSSYQSSYSSGWGPAHTLLKNAEIQNIQSKSKNEENKLSVKNFLEILEDETFDVKYFLRSEI